MPKRLKRGGKTVTFSVSVDAQTKKVLRAVAERSYRGNVSELIAQIAHQAARQEGAADLLRLHGRAPMTDEQCLAFESEIAAELGRARPAHKRRRPAA